MTINIKNLPLQVRIKDAADLMSYSESKIYKLIQSKEIRTVGKGRLRRIPTQELLLYMKKQGYEINDSD